MFILYTGPFRKMPAEYKSLACVSCYIKVSGVFVNKYTTEKFM